MTTALAILPPGGLTTFDRPTIEPIATEMARVYDLSIASIMHAHRELGTACQDLRDVFESGEHQSWTFSIGYEYRGRGEQLDKIIASMKRAAWAALADKLGIKNVMSMAARKKFDDQLEKDDLPDITTENIINIVLGLVSQAEDFAKDAVLEAFEFLRGRRSKYKTNKQYRVGKRVILDYAVESYGSGRYHLSYHKDAFYRSITGVMLILDGKTPLRDGPCEIAEAVRRTDDTGRGETEYFKFRCFKNHNMHLEFKRLDLLQRLNLIATGSNEIGDDE